jgi:3-phenylpropionate/trans-cinnamate dioxygenase ferredoxin subunit
MTQQAIRFVKVGQVAEVPPGGRETFDVDGRHIAVFRLKDGFYAIEDICTHDGGPLAEGEVEDDVVVCPRHGARFSIKTGAALSLPAFVPVESFPVRVDGDDLLIGIPEE